MSKIKNTIYRVAIALVISALPLAVGAQIPGDIQYSRPYDQRGVNVFESPSETHVAYKGIQAKWGAAFTQQFQSLGHSNAAGGLVEIGHGFNTATANLNLDVQLVDGVRVNVITYMSSRHHPEAWVKGGYLQADKLTFLNSQAIDNLMQYLTVRVGHFEINYGDAHFRRTDNANALYNPFVGNYIMNAFNTEIGAEIYFRNNGLLAMVGMTGGEIKGSVDRPDGRSPAFLGKVGYDKQLTDDLRVRLTGSVYTTNKSLNNRLYSDDRGGSRYYLVMEADGASKGKNFRSGRFNPGFRSEVTAWVVNPFIKLQGLEIFGNVEQATGKAANETSNRS